MDLYNESILGFIVTLMFFIRFKKPDAMKTLKMKRIFILILILVNTGLLFAQECSPNYKEVFDFNVGDYFHYVTSTGDDEGDFTNKTESYIIVQRLEKGDTLEYIRKGIHESLSMTYWLHRHDTSFYEKSIIYDTVQYIDSTDHFLNKCAGALVNYADLIFESGSHPKSIYYTILQIEHKDSLLIKKFGGPNNYYTIDSAGKIIDTLPWIGGQHTNFGSSYIKGLGLYEKYINSYISSSNNNLTKYHKATVPFVFLKAEISNGDTVNICKGKKVILRANKESDLTYLWFKNGQAIVGATSDTLEVSDSGSYQVFVTKGDYELNYSKACVVKIQQCSNEGLVAWYPFNGNANDKSGNGNNGNVNGAILVEDRFGNSNSAYSFNSSSNIQIGKTNFPSENQPRTISLWYYTPITPMNTQPYPMWCLFNYGTWSSSNSFGIFVCSEWEDEYLIRFDACGYQLDGYKKLHINNWYNIVVTYTGTIATVYINGQLYSTAYHSLNTILWDGYIGSWFPTVGWSFSASGIIDDIKVYNRVLNESEIQVLYNEKFISIIAGSDSSARVGSVIEISIATSELKSTDNIISYQFGLRYDNTKLKYLDCKMDSTIAEGGTINVNSEITGQLSIGYINSIPIIGAGSIANLKFKVTGQGNSSLTISNFLYNTDTVSHIRNGFVTAYLYGDIDANSFVQAYDAALTLQYSVGLDPLPAIDPLPWESWRIETADVDGVPGITAYDASLILKKSIGLITKFPVEDTLNSQQTSDADIVLKVENNDIVFYSKGNLFGLNVNAGNSNNSLGTPVVLDNSMIKAFNNQNNKYEIGVATANSPAENAAFMKIPYSKKGSVTFNLIINTEPKSVTVDLTTGIVEYSNENISIYPNPATDNLTISGIVQPTVANIYALDGQLLKTNMLNYSINDISLNNIPEGIYFIKLQTDNEIIVKRFVKL